MLCVHTQTEHSKQQLYVCGIIFGISKRPHTDSFEMFRDLCGISGAEAWRYAQILESTRFVRKRDAILEEPDS